MSKKFYNAVARTTAMIAENKDPDLKDADVKVIIPNGFREIGLLFPLPGINTSLLRKSVNKCRQKFYSIGPRNIS